jgi:GR25 family glycosyltransferase involved in LPS biosynthesis
MKNQLEKLKIEYTIIEEEPQKSDFINDMASKLAKIQKMKALEHLYNEQIAWPAASLAWKHLLFLEKAMNSERVCLALEDDAILSDNFVHVINSIIADNSWDVVFPGSGCNLRTPGIGLVRVPHPASKCTDSYLITPDAARKIYSTLKKSIDFPIDWELNYQMMHHDLKVFWHEPPIVKQGSQDGTWTSTINGKREDLFK